ncbi:MAG TPA: cation diffusion facilitator family transporter, partial [Nitrococcus sp.]|nr:cation diffusion facilitator family transporter [Nitrococcus sp.]
MASSRKVIYVALAGNLAIAVIKFIAAIASGSAAMAAEGIHSVIDCGNEVLLLVGIRRSRRLPDAEHPFGYGKTLYYYSLIVAIMIFMLGGGISIVGGARHIIEPPDLSEPRLTFAGLIASILFEGTSWIVAWRQFRTVKGNRSIAEEVRRSKDPTSFAVFFEDTAAVAGLVVALILLAS